MIKILLTMLLVISVFVMFFPNDVYANRIWAETYRTTVNNIHEIDEIIGNDLYVDMSFDFFIPVNLSQVFNNATIRFTPSTSTYHGKPEIYKIVVCGNSSGGESSGYTFGSRNIYCTDIKDFPINESKEYKYSEYTITIPIEDSSWKNYDIHILYKIPDFTLREGSNYILAFFSSCVPGGEYCKIENWRRVITLPQNSVLEDISGDIRIRGIDNGRWVFDMEGGEMSFIRYYNSVERNVFEPLMWTLVGAGIGAFTGAVLGALLQSKIITVFKKLKAWIYSQGR